MNTKNLLQITLKSSIYYEQKYTKQAEHSSDFEFTIDTPYFSFTVFRPEIPV